MGLDVRMIVCLDSIKYGMRRLVGFSLRMRKARKRNSRHIALRRVSGTPVTSLVKLYRIPQKGFPLHRSCRSESD